MELQDKITLDMLTEDSVSILKQQFIDLNGTMTQVGDNWRRSYTNSPTGRAELSGFLEDPYLSAVMNVWGDSPTVEDKPEHDTQTSES